MGSQVYIHGNILLVTVYRSDYADKVAKTQRNKSWCTNLSYVGNLYELFN